MRGLFAGEKESHQCRHMYRVEEVRVMGMGMGMSKKMISFSFLILGNTQVYLFFSKVKASPVLSGRGWLYDLTAITRRGTDR